MNFTEVHRSTLRAGDRTWSLHAAGCADVAREIREGGEARDFEAGSVAAARLVVIDAELVELGYSQADLQVYPCVTRGPKAPAVLAPGVCAGTGQAFTDSRTDRHLYRACPVCGRLVGARRGVAPRHGAAA